MLRAKVFLSLFSLNLLLGCNKDSQFVEIVQSDSLINLADILISEILIDPKKDGVEFVEIYNNSSKTISLNSLHLASINSTGERSKLHIVSPNNEYIYPSTYKLLSKDSEKVQAQYPFQNKSTFHNMPTFPALTNTGGAVILFMNNHAIDSLFYDPTLHNRFIKNSKGVSLERVSFSKASHLKENFTSAAASSGYATPGYQNSQLENKEEIPKTVFLNEKVFDISGKKPLKINIHLSLGAKMANIHIYNAKGNMVQTLAKNQLIGTKEQFNWNGKDHKNQYLSGGIYYIYIEIFDSNGLLKTYKEAFILINKI